MINFKKKSTIVENSVYNYVSKLLITLDKNVKNSGFVSFPIFINTFSPVVLNNHHCFNPQSILTNLLEKKGVVFLIIHTPYYY